MISTKIVLTSFRVRANPKASQNTQHPELFNHNYNSSSSEAVSILRVAWVWLVTFVWETKGTGLGTAFIA